jgi:hypothetical protein
MLFFFLAIAITVAVPLAAEQSKHPMTSVWRGLRVAIRDLLDDVRAILTGIVLLTVAILAMYWLFQLVRWIFRHL